MIGLSCFVMGGLFVHKRGHNILGNLSAKIEVNNELTHFGYEKRIANKVLLKNLIATLARDLAPVDDGLLFLFHSR